MAKQQPVTKEVEQTKEELVLPKLNPIPDLPVTQPVDIPVQVLEVPKVVISTDKQATVVPKITGYWTSFSDRRPQEGQTVEVYWTSDITTETKWTDTVSYSGTNAPRFWRVVS